MENSRGGGTELYYYEVALPYNVTKTVEITNGSLTQRHVTGGYNTVDYYAYVIDGIYTEIQKNSYITASYDSSTNTATVTLVGPNYAHEGVLYVLTDIEQTIS